MGLSFQAFFDSSNYINPLVIEFIRRCNIRLHDIKQQSLQEIVKTNAISTIYSALPERILPWPDCKILGTVHGLRSLEMPFDFFSRRQFDRGIIGLNTIIAWKNDKKNKNQTNAYYKDLLNKPNFDFVTVSKHSKNEIYKVCEKKDIPTFYPPSTSTLISSREPKEDFFLLVSANRVEKNCIRAIIALDQLISEKKISSKIKIKVTGITGNIYRYRLVNPENFAFLGYIDEDELDKLYANAYAFIYPSLNEGFGYPPLEAMKYQVPVIASNAASIPEVCGNAALYFKPTSIIEMKSEIMKLQDCQIYSDLQNKGKIRFNQILARQIEDLDKLIHWIIQNS